MLWLVDIMASIKGGVGRVLVSNPVAAANIIGAPDKSAIGGMLTRGAAQMALPSS